MAYAPIPDEAPASSRPWARAVAACLTTACFVAGAVLAPRLPAAATPRLASKRSYHGNTDLDYCTKSSTGDCEHMQC